VNDLEQLLAILDRHPGGAPLLAAVVGAFLVIAFLRPGISGTSAGVRELVARARLESAKDGITEDDVQKELPKAAELVTDAPPVSAGGLLAALGSLLRRRAA